MSTAYGNLRPDAALWAAQLALSQLARRIATTGFPAMRTCSGLLADVDQHASAVTRRSTVLVLGDGRGNGNEPHLDAFVEITRRARETIWLTPEPRYSWALGRCDLPLYSEHCDRVRVVRDLSGLELTANEMAGELIGR